MKETNPHHVKAQVDSDLLAIRRLIAEEPVSAKAPTLRRKPDADAIRKLAAAVAERHNAAVVPEQTESPAALERPVEPNRPATAATRADPGLSATMRKARWQPPRARRVAWGAVIFIAILKPWLMLFIVTVSVLALVWALLTLGSDRFWGAVLTIINRIGRTRPERARMLHARLDALAMRWDVVLDHFPEAWVESLYMPDLAAIQQADARHDRAMSTRLDRLRDEAAA